MNRFLELLSKVWNYFNNDEKKELSNILTRKRKSNF